MDDFGPYVVIGQVAVGSTATVYKSRHRQIDRIAAIKDLNPELRTVPLFIGRFRDEARLLAEFDDEHIVTVYDFVEEPTRSWIAEEWVDGATVETVLTSYGPMTAEQSLGVLRGALLGLAYAHDRHVVHGDLSPGNIITDLNGTSMLIDFGLSAPIGSTGVRGTPAFTSPEAVRGEPLGTASDVYAIGAVLFLLLTGRPPFPAATAEAVLQAHLERPAPAVREHGAALAGLLADSLAKDPAARPPDARAFLERMEHGARERYGANWLDRASVAGVVTAATGGAAGAAMLTSGASGLPTGGGAPAPSDTSHVDLAASTGRAARRLSRGAKIAVGAGVGVVAAGTVLAVALSSGSATPRSAALHNTASQTPSPVATVSTLRATPLPALRSVPTGGRYRFVSRIASTNFPGSAVGTTTTRTWTVRVACATGSCTLAVTSSSGLHLAGTFDGTAMNFTKTVPVNGPCVYPSGPKKGKVAPHTFYRRTDFFQAHLSVVRRSPGPQPASGTAVLLTGTGSDNEPSGTVSAGCTNDGKTYRATYAYTMTYLGG